MHAAGAGRKKIHNAHTAGWPIRRIRDVNAIANRTYGWQLRREWAIEANCRRVLTVW
jgi:hypothetical protein